MKPGKISFLLIGMIVLACQSETPIFNALEGTWKIEDKNEFERWTKNADGSFNSVMFSLNGVDTVFSETVKIYKAADGQWVFETLVNGQNNDESVKFNSSKLTSQKVVFENQNHDFPNLICYELASSNKLNAYIAGKGDTIRFSFARY